MKASRKAILAALKCCIFSMGLVIGFCNDVRSESIDAVHGLGIPIKPWVILFGDKNGYL
jgi:hypothetical protein